ncbi:agmatinase [Candidatus Mancarchaeum acidiphilum]|uniref:Agmatinase n=1 Tax=Candidatus Mancarchaeum acidiphilum TaxID=1920749 RepID=A0A218NMJ2_9ARCH|nr:agmatinase [Candidatus Mancarchaeum acidiphilum]ASI13688.1 agmatinase [Candidatus Mancarchaeum acidiphilum]
MDILNSMPPYNLFGLEGSDYDKAKVVAIPIPYDSTTSYRSGSREGPHAVIEASRNIELYSEILEKDISRMGIYTTEEILPDVSSPENMVKRIESEVSHFLDDEKIPLVIGGEHTVMVGSLRAVSNKYGKDGFSVLHFDAHSDSRDSFMGSKYSHACVMARARELCDSCYSVGVRSIDEEDYRKYKDILYMKDINSMDDDSIADMIIRSTKKKLYFTFDLDVMDPSEMPSVGTPEPDGMRYKQISNILSKVFPEKEVIGMDFTELCPIPGFTAPNYIAAKLIYTALGYAFVANKK